MTIARSVFAGLAVVAMGDLIIVHRNENPDFRLANFFSFFTIESNIFAAVVLIMSALRDGRDEADTSIWVMVRGAAVLYISITGIVYGLLLSGYTEELQTNVPWADSVLHKIIPLAMVADWLIDPPQVRLPLKRALIWLVYPLVFCAYSLIRGPIVDWDPYPFLDPDLSGGYGGVALYCVAIAFGAIIGVWIVVTLGNRVRLAAVQAPVTT